MNIVNLLGITYKEDIISNLIVGLINESKVFRNSFIKNILNIENPSDFKVKAYTRIATSAGIPDIIVTLENEKDSRLLIVENKLKADEGFNQTLRYSDEKCIEDLVDNKLLELKNKDLIKEFIFLTLIPEQIPTGDKFKNITYKDLIENVDVDIEDEVLKRVYCDFVSILKDFYKDLDINEYDKLIDSCFNEEDKTRAFIKFKNIVKNINGKSGLSVREIGKAGGNGRLSYYAKISKDSWIGNEEARFIDDTYKITEDCYDIHLEASFDIFNKKMTLPLHYEPRPYIPRKRLIEKTNEEDYQKYITKRNCVKGLVHNEIHDLGDSNIKPYNGSNTIASINIPIDENITIKEFIESIEKYMIIVENIVDKCLK